jgi:hypothetical protein
MVVFLLSIQHVQNNDKELFKKKLLPDIVKCSKFTKNVTLIGEDLCLYNACFNFSNINISDIYIRENISDQVYLPFIYM